MLEKFLDKNQKYATAVLRTGLAIIFIWSGTSKLAGSPSAIGVCTNREAAAAYFHSWGWLPFSADLMVDAQSYLEIALGILLLAGFYVRIVAMVCSLLFILFFLIIDVNLIWKNFGLLGGSLSLALTGSNVLSLPNKSSFIQNLFKRRNNQ